MAARAVDKDTGSTNVHAVAAPSSLNFPLNFDWKLLAAFHGAADHVKVAICTLLKTEMVEGEAQARVSPKGKRKHVSERDEGSGVKRARTSMSPSLAESIDFRSIKNPEVPIHCIIQVNVGPPDGSLDTREAGYSIRVILDGGTCHSPSIGLRFKYPGSEGPDVARVRWHIDSRAEDRWVIRDLEYVLVSEAPHDKAVNHAAVIDQCEGTQSLERLICITLRLTSHAGGSCQRPARDSAQSTKTYLNAIFWKGKDYTLRIWFLRPWANKLDLDTRCLAIMRYLFNQRQEPLRLAQDASGTYSADSTKAARYGISPVVPQHQRDPWTGSISLNLPMVPAEVDMPQTGGHTHRATAGRAPLIAAKRTGPATAASPAKQLTSDDEDGEIKEEDVKIKKEEGETPAAERSTEGSGADEEVEDSRSARSARGIFLGTSAAGDEVARAHTGYYMRDGEEEDEGWKGDENFTPAPPSRGLFSMLDSEAIKTPQYFLDFEEDDEEEE